MDNVIDMSGFSGVPNAGHAEVHCWLCQKGNTLRAFFCQHCGTIQPVRPVDHFTRLGLERRIDIDLEQLDRHYTNLQRTFSPERFAIRGLGERGHAAKQLEALEEAYVTLRDPLKRSRYWLDLHEMSGSQIDPRNPLISELQRELDGAGISSQCDRIAQKAGHAMEQGIVGLMQALRGQNWQLAGAMLAEVEGLETILNDARNRRQILATDEPHQSGDVTRIR